MSLSLSLSLSQNFFNNYHVLHDSHDLRTFGKEYVAQKQYLLHRTLYYVRSYVSSRERVLRHDRRNPERTQVERILEQKRTIGSVESISGRIARSIGRLGSNVTSTRERYGSILTTFRIFRIERMRNETRWDSFFTDFSWLCIRQTVLRTQEQQIQNANTISTYQTTRIR